MSRQADNAVTFSFDGPKNVDLNALQAAINTEAGVTEEPAQAATAAEAKAEPVEAAAEQITQEEVAESKEADTQVAAKAEPQPEVRTHKITVDGQELEVTEADLKLGHMRHRDYTQKTQKLSAREKELDAKEQEWQRQIELRDQELAQIDAFLKNQAAVDAYREKAFGRAEPVEMPVVDPSKPLSPEDVAKIARYNAEQVRIANQRELAEMRAAILKQKADAEESQKAVQREQLGSKVDDHIKRLVEKFPVLNKLEDIGDILISDASKFAPKSLDEALTRLSEAAERRYVAMKSIVDEDKKQAAIKAAELKKKSTEPIGGTAPRPQQGKKLTLDSRDQKALRAAAEEDLRALLNDT